MSRDAAISGYRVDPSAERMTELLRELCLRDGLGAEDTAAVIRKAGCEPGATSVDWPPDVVPQLRRFVLKS